MKSSEVLLVVLSRLAQIERAMIEHDLKIAEIGRRLEERDETQIIREATERLRKSTDALKASINSVN